MCSAERQRRILLLVHDGAGLGHLRRVSRIAAALQGPAAALVVTGMREAAWIVPPECEILRLPGWDGLSRHRAAYYGRSAWLSVSPCEALAMRKQLFAAVCDVFRPDAVIVDYLPFGRRDEWKDLLVRDGFRKYFVLRGIVDTSDDFLRGSASDVLGAVFDRIFVTAEKRVVDVVRECQFGATTAAKTLYTGYVVAPSSIDRKTVRSRRGIGHRGQWVVCSAGGGKRAESFLMSCVAVAATLPDVTFDVILGPRAKVADSHALDAPPNCRIWSECRDVPEMHSSCDVAITAGGYNSLLEAARGGARIIVQPSYSGTDDEQYENARRLGALHPIVLLHDPAHLRDELLAQLMGAAREQTPPIALQCGGEQLIRDVIFGDLGC
jgi:predicted glycosyltransferase